jgi:DNA gyrase/topoisomerase IV subunit A
VGGFGGMTDLERKELQAEFSRLEAEIEDLKMVRDSPERREQIIKKTARSQVVSVKLME